jgi:PadR family transcriptional regulator PadR
MPDDKIELLLGTLDLLILKTLALEPSHGWGIAQRIQDISKDALRINQGSLYPALQKLEREGWISRRDGVAENNRRVSVYALTASGRRQLARRVETWNRFSDAVGLILRAT